MAKRARGTSREAAEGLGGVAPDAGGASNDTLTAIDGLHVGHWTDPVARTGCTVVLAPEGGCLASGLVLGPAPGSRESVLLQPDRTVDRIDAVLLTGGSAFGLAAATGVVRWLEEQGRGYDTGVAKVPIVPAAVLFDLGVGSATVRPGDAAGHAAAVAASAGPVAEGRVGAGTGATVGKLRGMAPAAPSGIGSFAVRFSGVTVAALAVSNAVGNLVDPDTGALVAGVEGTLGLAAVEQLGGMPGANTTLVVAATDARITKAEAYALSLSAQMGIARVTRPTHTPFDGDSAFVLSTGRGPTVPLAALSVAVQEVVAAALLRGARAGRAAGAA